MHIGQGHRMRVTAGACATAGALWRMKLNYKVVGATSSKGFPSFKFIQFEFSSDEPCRPSRLDTGAITVGGRGTVGGVRIDR